MKSIGEYMKAYNYKITATHLNAFQRMLDAEVDSEQFANIDRESGEYKQTADELYAEREQALLDYINRVPREPNEYADRGTAFNAIVDCLLSNSPCDIEGLQIDSIFLTADGVLCEDRDNLPSGAKKVIRAQINGFIFYFDIDFCKRAAEYYKDTLHQLYVCAGLPTQYGEVMLYGYADYVGINTVADMKTTATYTFPKYERGWQRYVYSYCLIEGGMQEIRYFEYTAFLLKQRAGVLSGDITPEVYVYNHEDSKQKLTQVCERFIEWLERNREKITDKKVFGA